METQNLQQPSTPYREKITLTIIACYLIPIIIYSSRAIGLLPPSQGWSLLTTGLLLSITGSIILILMIKRWEPLQSTPSIDTKEKYLPSSSPDYFEEALQQQIATLQQALKESQQAQYETIENSKKATNEFQEIQTERDSLQQEINNLHKDCNARGDHIGETEIRLNEYEKVITEQNASLERQQHIIAQLENKIHDLTYEVKTLLQLSDIENSLHIRTKTISHPVIDLFRNKKNQTQDTEASYRSLPTSTDKRIYTPYDAAVQLHKCLDIANNLANAAHLEGKRSRFKDLSITDHSIDLRRLFDSFRNETSCVIVLYSPQENRMLYANNQIKGLLDWSPEKFTKNFFPLIQEGVHDWQTAIKQMEIENENQVRIVLKTRSGKNILLYCHLGKIQKGVFRDYILGVMYPT